MIEVFEVRHYNFHMSGVFQILVSRLARRGLLAAGVVVLLAACGQKGPLFLPSGEAAAGRATLPQTLNPMPAPSTSATPATAASAPATGTAAPIRNP
jgi:predicted small lipoprotein YifL